MFIMGLLFSSCEKEGMNEAELMKKIGETDFTIVVRDNKSDRPIDGAQLKLTSNGEVLTAETDSSGRAVLTEVSTGKASLHITREGYFDHEEQITINTTGREASVGYTASLFSKDDAARIVGNVKFQTNLTTDSAEHPEGIVIKAFDNDDAPIAETKTKANGDFELLIPTDRDGRNVWIKFPDLEYDQKIAVRKNDSTVVEKTAVGTIFKPYPEYGETDKVKSTSNIDVEIDIPDDTRIEEYARQAYIKSLTVESGSVTDVKIGYPGRGYDKWYTYHVVISSDSVSQWDEAVVEVDGTYDSYPYFRPLNPSTVQINDPGNNYPEHDPNDNVYTQPPKGFIWGDDYHYSNARVNNLNKVKAGEVYRIDANYGTGTERGEIQ
jgi:hypothetical protein